MNKTSLIYLLSSFVLGLIALSMVLFQRQSILAQEGLKKTNEIEKLLFENQKLHSNLFYLPQGSLQKMNKISPTPSSTSVMTSIQPGRKLVFRFASTHCNLCYEEELRRLNLQSESMQPKDIVILTSFPEQHFRGLKNKFEKIYPHGRFLNTRDFVDLNEENYHEPYYFILEADSLTHSFFFPDKALPDLSRDYLNYIKRVFKH